MDKILNVRATLELLLRTLAQTPALSELAPEKISLVVTLAEGDTYAETLTLR